MPWPSEAAPVTTSTMPELSTDTRTPSNGPSPLFSTKSARPAPMHSPTPRRRFVEQTGIIAGIQHDLGAEGGQRAAVRHLVFADQVAPAHFDAIHRKPRRDRVHQALAHERAFKPARR